MYFIAYTCIPARRHLFLIEEEEFNYFKLYLILIKQNISE